MTERTTKLTHVAVGCGDVEDIDTLIFIGDINEVDCPKCLTILDERKAARAVKQLADAVTATEQALGALKWAQQANEGVLTVDSAAARVNWMQVARDALTDALTTLEEKP